MPAELRRALRWKAQTSVLESIKALFSGWEDAIVELVKNAIDGDADEVRIFCTEGKGGEGDPFLRISDTGTIAGMSEEKVEKYVIIGRDKRLEDGLTSPGGRTYLGKRGTGKIASLVVARHVSVETVRDGWRRTFEYTEQSIRAAADGVEGEINVEAAPDAPNGTTVTLTLLNPSLFLNLALVARTVLLRDFAQVFGVKFFVNDQEFSPTDLAVSADRFDEDVPGCGHVIGEIWIARRSIKTPGLVVYHEGQRVSDPSMFGVSKSAYHKDARAVADCILGRIDVEPVDGFTSAPNWRLSESYRSLEAWITARIKGVVTTRLDDHLRDRVDGWLRNRGVKRYWDELNDAEKAETRAILMKRAEVARDDKAETIIAGLVARAMRVRNLSIILTAIDEADDPTINTFAEILGGENPWQLRQVAVAATIVKERLRTLDRLKSVTGEAAFDESAAHELLEQNPWIIADDFLSFRSNKTLRTALRELGIVLPKTDGSTRPDMLFLLGNEETETTVPAVGAMRYLFVELKGPDQPLAEKQQNQTTGYVNKFLRHMGGGYAYVWLIGSEFDRKDPAVTELSVPTKYEFRAMTYLDIIALAQRRLTYINDAQATRVEILTKKVIALEVAEISELTTAKTRATAAASVSEATTAGGAAG